MASIDKVVAKLRSVDSGKTWKEEGVVWDPSMDDKKYCYYHGGPTRLRNGELIAVLTRFDRSDPSELMWDPQTSGYPSADIIVSWSQDMGHSWRKPEIVKLPDKMIGNHSGTILELDNGDLFLTFETWKHCKDTKPPVQKSLAFISSDKGKSWKDLVTVADGSGKDIFYFDQRLAMLGNRKLIALLWTFDSSNNKTLPVNITVSEDNGRTWSEPAPTNITDGFISCPVYLGGTKVLAAYTLRYGEKPGIYAVISENGGFKWNMDERIMLWDATGNESTGLQKEIELESMMGYAFGMPHAILLENGEILVCYWCTSGCITHIRWCRIEV